jgi:SAM-dependent methyltransferase
MTTTPSPTDQVDAVVERLFLSMVDGMDVVAVAIGDRLGYYRALDEAPRTPDGLAEATGSHERYAREWLEQQAMSGYLVVEDGVFRLAPGVAESLARPGTSAWVAPMLRQFAAAAAHWADVADGARTGAGLPWAGFGRDMYESQSDVNAAALLESLAGTWLPAALPGLHARLSAGETVRVADVGCGGGWAGIALARAFPGVHVDGFDVDGPTVELARANVESEGLADRVRVLEQDLAEEYPAATYDLVMAFECIHDMPHPVPVLTAMGRMVRPDGRVLVADMAGAEEFTPDGDPAQRCLYGYSVLVCLPDAMSGNPEGATGTVLRPATMDRYAREAGLSAATPLAVDHDLWRFYELMR